MKENTNNPIQTSEIALSTLNDFKNSLIIVSVLVNLAVLTTWMVAQLSSTYATQLISLL